MSIMQNTRMLWKIAPTLRTTFRCHSCHVNTTSVMQSEPCEMDIGVQQAAGMRGASMMDTYNKYWHPFGLLLTDMEKEGMAVNMYVIKA